jgi:hypothetical protein
MARTGTIVSDFPTPLLRTPSNAIGRRPDPTWAPVKGLEPNAINRDDHDAHARQDQFASALEAASLEAASKRDTDRWDTALKANPHDAIRQAKYANELLGCIDIINEIDAAKVAFLPVPSTPRG